MATLSDYSVTIHGGRWAVITNDGWDYEVVEGGFESMNAALDRLDEIEAEDAAALEQEHHELMERLAEVRRDARAARAMLELGK